MIDTKNNNKILKLITALIIFIFLLSVIYISVNFFTNTPGLTANIYQDGDLLYSINLSDIDKSYELVIKGSDGSSNTVFIENDGVTMINATCPDHICVNSGKITTSLLPITCLPNKVVISLTTTRNNQNDEVQNDAIAY